MTECERLVELLYRAFMVTYGNNTNPILGQVADHLLANGVIVPPCKIGDTVYRAIKGLPEVYSGTAVEIVKDEHCVYCRLESGLSVGHRMPAGTVNIDRFGVSAFLTREEAEAALKEMRKNDK